MTAITGWSPATVSRIGRLRCRNVAAGACHHTPCGMRLCVSAGAGGEPGLGRATLVPWMLLNGTVGENVGRFFARTWVVASKPDGGRS